VDLRAYRKNLCCSIFIDIYRAKQILKTARDSNLQEKKVAAKEVFGSNLRLASRAVRGEPVFPYLSVLRSAESVRQKSESLISVVCLTKSEPFLNRIDGALRAPN
jgi:hypothetical protein